MTFPNLNLKVCQQGAATLIVVMVLAMIMGVVALTTANVGLMEQKIVGNDLRAREAREAAEAGLEYGVAWAKNNSVPNTVTCSSGSLPTGCPTALTTVVGSSTGESYSYTLTYTKGTDSIKVTSAAQGVTDNSIAAASEAWITQMSYLTAKGKSAAPFVINGSLSNVTGNPDINTGNPPGVAIATSQAVSAIDTGNFNKHPPPALGAIVNDTFPATATPAWDYLFSISLASATATAIANGYDYPAHTLPATPASGKEPFYVWDSDTHISANYGSAAQPVVIIVKDGKCPKLNGGPVIYGFVYFPASCNDQGWGNATIHGSIVSEGNITKVAANSISIGNGIGGGGTDLSSFISDASRLPGTWKDF
jgi:Tfp pilus assembly protein PilX